MDNIKLVTQKVHLFNQVYLYFFIDGTIAVR